MQKSIYFAKSLVVLSYALLYLLLFILVLEAVRELWFQAIFNVCFIVLIVLTQERLFSAFLQALGSFRVDSALRRIGGIAELIDNLHEYTELDGLLRYTQTSLSALMGGAGVKVFIAQTANGKQADKDVFLYWTEQGLQRGPNLENVLQYSKEMQQSFSIKNSPSELSPVFEEQKAQVILPVFFGRKLLAIVMLRDPSNVYDELQELLAFFSRQLGVALERVKSEELKRQRQEQAFAEKTAALATLSATIAHEMRTPLSGVRASIGGADSYLPELVEAYHYAHQKDPNRFPIIRKELLDALADTGPRIKSMVDQANHVIDLLLANLNNQQTDKNNFSTFSIAQTVQKALDQYPFKRDEREKIHLVLADDFQVLAEQSLLIYVLFNLLKNALYSIESAGHGEVTISLESRQNKNCLIFEDTGLGIDRATLPLIFGGFFSTRSNGTGAGLPFCRRTMRSFAGEIDVSSELGVGTQFLLEFPPVEPNAETSS